ncbi:MAG: hypothetical protein HY660_05105 [Armatimonadetes bacterium]|nr:hypothetical protein [Armatimonadota bacterium]
MTKILVEQYALPGVDAVEFAGGEVDLIAALAFRTPRRVRDLFVEGRPVVRNGRLVRVDEDVITGDGRRVGRRIVEWSLRRMPG